MSIICCHHAPVFTRSARSAKSRHPINLSAGCVPCYSRREGHIGYCAPAWSGTCSAADRMRLDSFLNRCKRLGFADTDMSSVTELFSDAYDAFLERIMTNSEHVLQPFLPEKTDLSYNLTERTHNRSLITKTIDLTERDFSIRMLYKDCY